MNWSSIEEFCTDVVIIDKGKTVLKGNLKEIRNGYKANKIELSTTENVDKFIEDLKLNIISNKNNDYEIEINEEEQGFKLIKNLIENNINVIKFEMKKPSLNDIFIEKVGK